MHAYTYVYGGHLMRKFGINWSNSYIEIWGIKNDNFAIPTLVCSKSFSGTDTYPTLCALMLRLSTVVWKKFTVGYFRVKFIRVEIFSSLGASNE